MEEVIQRVVGTLRDEYRPDRIILFGSRVRGEAGEESDLDVLIIKESEQDEVARMQEVHRLLHRYQRRPYRLALDILVKTPEEVRQRLAMGDLFLRGIIERGKLVYERVVV